jgi:dihydroorotase
VSLEPEARIHIKKARVIDPGSGVDREQDLIVLDGKIERIGKGLSAPKGGLTIEGSGLVAIPGMIDLHAHLREPGEEYKEDIASGAASAAVGGFTSVCVMPNTKPPNDSRSITEMILARAKEANGARVYPVGAITRGLLGETLSDIGDLKASGVVALSDDGRPVMSAGLMRRALEYGRTFDLPVVQHCEDLTLSHGGVMNEGAASTRAGLRGQPRQAEEVMVSRDIALVELTGARYHVAHMSTARSVELVRDAKKRGLPVTCEVTPHHLMLTDEACLGYDTSTKVNPPLREKSDIDALREALRDGIIDAIATDHAPHSGLEKDVEFDCAAFGMIGFETALGVVLRLVHEGSLKLEEAIRRLTDGPARCFHLPGGRLTEGGPADVTLIDLDRAWTVDPTKMRSKSRNSPFAGWQLKGKAVLTIVNGRIVYDDRGGS